MVIEHSKRKGRKLTGGRYKKVGKKKKDFGDNPTLPNIATKRVKVVRGRGATSKRRLLAAEMINVVVKGKAKAVKMTNVVENLANRHYVRRNALTKGAVVETELGKVQITSRPAQDGCMNGVLVE